MAKQPFSNLDYQKAYAGKAGVASSKDITGRPIQTTKKLKSGYIAGFKKGGKVKKTGVYKLHKGEKVLTKKQQIKKAAEHLFGN